MSTVYLTREVANEFINSSRRSDNPNLKKIAEIYQEAIRAGGEVNSSEGIIIFPKGKEKDLKNFNVLLGDPWDLAQFFNNRATLESKEREDHHTEQARKEMKIFVNSVKSQVCFSAEGRLSGIWNRLVVTVLSLGSWLGCSCATMAIAKRIETLAIKLIDRLHKDIATASPTQSPRPSEPDVLPVAQATGDDDGRGLGAEAALRAMDARAARNAERREQVRNELADPNPFGVLDDEDGTAHQDTMHPEARAAVVAALVEGLSDSEGESA